MNIKNHTFIVTGAGSGMGKELSYQIVQKGGFVIGIDRNQETLSQTNEYLRDFGGLKASYVLDIANPAAIKTVCEDLITTHKTIDGVFNNAGIIQPFIPFNELDEEAIRHVMDVNFFGLVLLTKALLPTLLSRPEAHIVNTSSMGGFLPVPGQTIYGASKAAVKLFTEGLFAELTDTKVHVTLIFPGAIETNITSNSGIEMPSSVDGKSYKMLSAMDAAAQILKAVERNKYHAYIGRDAWFMNILTRLNPLYANRMISKQMKSLLKN
jgi:short-subunit dehydrogenase